MIALKYSKAAEEAEHQTRQDSNWSSSTVENSLSTSYYILLNRSDSLLIVEV